MKAIIFDFDGVIHDTFELGLQVLIKASGRECSKEKFKDYFDGNVFENWDVVSEDEDKKFFELQKEAFKYLKIDNEIRQNLVELSSEYTLFIVSSNQEENLNTYFQNNNFLDVFKEVLGAETHRSKVEKFKYIFQKYTLNVDDCIFVTDTLGDILEANKVELKTIAVDFGFHERERLEKGKPFKIISRFDEIKEIVKQI